MIEKNNRVLWGAAPMLRIIICDDDSVFLKRIYESICNIFKEMDIKVKIHCFSDANLISNHILSSCDIAFLDIDFAKKNYNGIDLGRRLREFRKDAIIIFVTNFIEYAPEGYEIQAFRYILKKELDAELGAYIEQAITHIGAHRETIKIQINGEIIDILLDDILYIEVQQHNVTLYVRKDKNGKTIKTYVFYASLSELESKLESRGFLRIHKSYLVNMKYMLKFQCREALLDNGTILRVSEKNYAENKRKYLLWKGWQ